MYTKEFALKYLIDTGPDHHNEWTEAGMYHALVDIIENKSMFFQKEYLDNLLKEATEF